MISSSLVLVVALVLVPCSLAVTYNVSFLRINGGQPILSSQASQSSFRYNYNTAVLPLQDGSIGLLVRAQNQGNPSDPWSVTSSVMPFTAMRGPFNPGRLSFQPITNSSVVFAPTVPEENYGVEDPRVTYRASTGEYILFYTAAQEYPNGTVVARLASATSKRPWERQSWKRQGVTFPSLAWSKSGALLLKDGTPLPNHLLIFGDATSVPGLQLATSADLKSWQVQPGVWLPLRPGMFDADLVEAGPHPLPLSDGNYLFLYNSARHGYPSPRPGYDFQYNVGWAVLDGRDPSKILARSSQPLLSPSLPWEIGLVPPALGLVPRVCFLEGWLPLPGSSRAANKFFTVYGGADSVLGAGIVSVTINP